MVHNYGSPRKKVQGESKYKAVCSEMGTPLYKKRLDAQFYVICSLPQFQKLRNRKGPDISEEAIWNHCSLEWSVSREEIKGIDLLSPSYLLFLIGQNFPPKVLNPLNLQTLSSMSSC